MLALGASLTLGAASARAEEEDDDDACSETATAQLAACDAEANDDFFVAQAICTNGPEEEEDACSAEARAGRREARLECREQHEARLELCEALGGGRYDPDFDPAHFDDDFGDLTSPNPYFPLGIGDHWEYVGGDERITIEVLDKTKLIEGVTSW